MLEVVYAGRGPVGDRCLEVLNELGVQPRILPNVPNSVIHFVENCDLLLSVHWPRLFDRTILSLPRIGTLNLHNSYLPWNRGADACSWAILDGTPHGATFHWVDEGIDTGDIFYQEQLRILPEDTAHSLYQRTADLEVQVFKVGMASFLEGDRTRIPQQGRGSYHRKKDLDLLVRALTTRDTEVVSREA